MAPPLVPLEQKFWPYVNKTDGCWRWVGEINGRIGNRYGRVRHHRNGFLKAHRVSYQLHYGEIPDGRCVLHRCDNNLCVNPDHLFLGTSAENNHDRHRKGRDYIKHSSLLVEEMFRLRNLGFNGVEISELIDVPKSTVHEILGGRSRAK